MHMKWRSRGKILKKKTYTVPLPTKYLSALPLLWYLIQQRYLLGKYDTVWLVVLSSAPRLLCSKRNTIMQWVGSAVYGDVPVLCRKETVVHTLFSICEIRKDKFYVFCTAHCKKKNIQYKPTICTFKSKYVNPLNPELNPICYLLALLGAHHFLHVSRIRVKLLTFRLPMSYIYGAPILDVSRSYTTTQHSR